MIGTLFIVNVYCKSIKNVLNFNILFNDIDN